MSERKPTWAEVVATSNRELTRDQLRRVGNAIGPNAASRAALAEMDALEAKGKAAMCVQKAGVLYVGPRIEL